MSKLKSYIARFRCRVCGYEDEGVQVEASTPYQARQSVLDCPVCDSRDSMEVIKLEGKID